MIDKTTVEQWMRDANPIHGLDEVDPDELAYAVAAVHTRRAAIMQAPTQHPTASSSVTPPPPRRRIVWAFAAAFIVVLAVVGIAALVTRGGDDAPVADEPTATTSAPGPIDVQSLSWSRVPHDEAVFDSTVSAGAGMADITVGGPGFVAVGQMGNDAGVWVSEAGITWSLVTSGEPMLVGPPPSTGGGHLGLESVTVGGPGLVAVGGDCNVPGVLCAATVWTSEDAISWSRITVDSEESWIYDVTAGGPGLVAVGGASREDCGGRLGLGGAVWTSVDGVTWNRVPEDPRLLCGIDNVTVGGPGLVAVGSTDDGATVWTSPDGLSWTRVPHDEAVFGGGAMLDVTAGGPGLVAVGSAGGGDYGGRAVWTSPDGITWTLVPPTGLPPGDASLRSVISVGSRLVAVGSDGVVWMSDDGVSWIQSEIPGGDEVVSVVATENGLIAVGAEDGAAAAWVATQG